MKSDYKTTPHICVIELNTDGTKARVISEQGKVLERFKTRTPPREG